MKVLHIVAFVLLVVGGLNWGLVGFFNYNLVTALFAGVPPVEQIVYDLVGLSAIYLVVTHAGECKLCAKK
jgi:uncharacterized protein